MKLITGNTFELNGVEERILVMPKERTDMIKFTMNGMREYAQELPLDVFEFNTGCFIEGLEPERDVDIESNMDRLVKHLEQDDFNVIIDDKGEIEASITFTNGSNSKISAFLHTISKEDEIKIFIGKKTYGTELKEIKANRNNFDLQVDRAIEFAKKFTSQKLQVLSKKSESTNSRDYDKNNIPVLKEGESLNDYFAENRDTQHAGIVLSSNREKFIPFYSFEAVSGRTLSHNTRTYKTLKGAAKFLDNLGYNQDGKVKDSVFDIDNVKSSLVNYSRSMSSLTTSSDCTAEISLNNGYITYSLPKIVQDSNLGARCFVDYEYIRESDGRSYKSSIEVSFTDRGLYAVDEPLFVHSSHIERDLESGSIDYPEDLRTDREKIQYHVDIIRSNQERIGDYEGYLKDGDRNKDFYERRVEELKEIINRHQESAKELKKSTPGNDLDR